MGDLLGRGKARHCRSILVLGGEKHSGAAVAVELVGNEMRLEVYDVGKAAGRTRLLVLQDSPGDGKPHSAEAGAARSLLASSFRATGR